MGVAMNQMSNEDFVDFIESYRNPKYFDTLENISCPRLPNGKKYPNKHALIEKSLKMFSLDDICKDCNKFEDNNRPTTTDALWYKVDDHDKLILYFIEFKWHNLNNKKDKKILEEAFLSLERGTEITKDMKDKFQKLNQSYIDGDVELKLRLKPFESIFIVLPMLYQEYSEKHPDKGFKDLDTFLKSTEIKVYSFVSDYDENRIELDKKDEEKLAQKNSDKNNKKSMEIKIDQSKRSKRRKFQERSQYNRFSGHTGSVGSTIRKQYQRLILSSYVDFADVFPKSSFDIFLKNEGLISQDN